MNSDTVSLLIIVICVIFSAYFSATETAFSTMNHTRMKMMADKGNSRAALALKLAGNYDRLLSTILIGNNLVNITLTSLATILCVRWIGEESGASAATLITTVVVLIFGEISPKSIAKESPETFVLFSAPILKFFITLLMPANFIFGQWKKLLSRVFKSSEDRGLTDEELLTLVEEAEQEGGIGKEEGSLIRSAIEFMDLETLDVYTPRVDIVAIPKDADKETIAGVFVETGFSRLPVYEDDIDHIVGVVNQKDFHNFIYRTARPLDDIIRPVSFIMPSMKIGALPKQLQEGKSHIAIILDEFGGTEGLITIEDIIEELVGDIWDEHDNIVKEIEKISDSEYIVTGTANINKVFETLDIDRDFEVTSVSGWIMEVLERVPQEGDHFINDGLEVTVLNMQEHHRIAKVRIRKLSECSASAPAV